MKRVDMVGQVFGSWTVLEWGQDLKWKCQCVCGTIGWVKGWMLRNGGSTKCRICRVKSTTRVDTAFRKLLATYKRNAKHKKLDWRLTDDQFRKLTSSPCYYTGQLPAHEQVVGLTGIYLYNGVDRVDNDKGYILSNCVPCASVVNFAKKNIPKKDFIEMCRQVAEKHPKKLEG